MRKKQMLALFMSLSLLAQGMLFSGCGQKSIGEEQPESWNGIWKPPTFFRNRRGNFKA